MDNPTLLTINDDSITLRDYFAGQALAACYEQITRHCNAIGVCPADWKDGVARDSYNIADAMLKARKEAQ